MVWQSLKSVWMPPLVWLLVTIILKPSLMQSIPLILELIKTSGCSVMLDWKHIGSAVRSTSTCTCGKSVLVCSLLVLGCTGMDLLLTIAVWPALICQYQLVGDLNLHLTVVADMKNVELVLVLVRLPIELLFLPTLRMSLPNVEPLKFLMQCSQVKHQVLY